MVYGRKDGTLGLQQTLAKGFSSITFQVETEKFNRGLDDLIRLTRMNAKDALELAHLLFLQSVNKLNLDGGLVSKKKKRPVVKVENARYKLIDPNSSPNRRAKSPTGKQIPSGFRSWREFWGRKRRQFATGTQDEIYLRGLYATFGSGTKRSKFPFDRMKKEWGIVSMRKQKGMKIGRYQDITYRGIGSLAWISRMPRQVNIPGVDYYSVGTKKLKQFTPQAEAKAKELGGFSDSVNGKDMITRTIWNKSLAYTKNGWAKPKINMTLALGKASNRMPHMAKAIYNKSMGGQKFAWRG